MSALAPIAEGPYRPIAVIATCSLYGTRPMGLEVPMANRGPIAAIATHSPKSFLPGSTVSLPIAIYVTILAQSMTYRDDVARLCFPTRCWRTYA